MRINKFYIEKWIKKNSLFIKIFMIGIALAIATIFLFWDKNNILIKKLIKLLEEEDEKFVDLSKEDTEEEKVVIKDLESEIEKTKEKIKEIETVEPKNQGLDNFFDERVK